MAPTTNKRSIYAAERTTRAGPGTQRLSPLKPRNKKKKERIRALGHEERRAKLRAELHALRLPDAAGGASSSASLPAPPLNPIQHETTVSDVPMPDWVDEEIFDPLSPPTPAPSPKKLARPGTRATRAERAAQQVAEAWNSLLPQLEEPYALYQQASHGQRPSIIPSSIQHQCTASCETSVSTTVQCLYISRSYSPLLCVTIH
jgi:hypothetical protein